MPKAYIIARSAISYRRDITRYGPFPKTAKPFRGPLGGGTDIIEKRHLMVSFFMAAEEGFEPSQTESESVVLPLHNSAIYYIFTPIT